jgi:pyruvate carboxylase
LVGLPIHLHTHDTAGIACATILAAADEGVDAVDCSMDALSGNTAQATLGTIVESLRRAERDTGLDIEAVRAISNYWEQVRGHYAAFETGQQAPASEVYLHEMPGGQFTNLKAQARSMGLEERWGEVAHAYADVNQMFGDIVKVTPSSKVVGDMALMMVSQGLTRADIEEGTRDIAFPDSVIEMMKGHLGQPPGGWPAKIQKRILKDEAPITERPGALLPPEDLEARRAEISGKLGGAEVDDEDLAGYLMYPKVFADYALKHQDYGPVRTLDTRTFFYGMAPGDSISPEIDPGKTLEIVMQTVGETNEQGEVRVFFELNGQPRTVRVPNRRVKATHVARPKAETGNAAHVGAPMPGAIAAVPVQAGARVRSGDLLVTIEAMKMETGLHAERDAVVKAVHVRPGDQVDAKDLLVELE